jgi:autoinducer 2 (AI-2) kinase
MKALVTADFTDDGLALLRRHAEVIYEPWSRTGALWMAEELGERVAKDAIDILVVEVDLVHEEVFDARTLRAIGCCRGDPLNVDVDTATERGVPVVFAPGRNARSVADLTIAFMLCLARSVVSTHHRLVSGELDPSDVKELVSSIGALRGFELGSATVGLLGFGAVGRETARRLAGFGSRVIAYDPRVRDAEFAALGVTRVELDALFDQSDILSLHAAVTPETRGIVSEERIARMKPGAFLINTARHQLVDADALYAALAEGRLGGATRDVVRHQTEMVAGDLDRILRGERPRHIANPSVLGG